MSLSAIICCLLLRYCIHHQKYQSSFILRTKEYKLNKQMHSSLFSSSFSSSSASTKFELFPPGRSNYNKNRVKAAGNSLPLFCLNLKSCKLFFCSQVMQKLNGDMCMVEAQCWGMQHLQALCQTSKACAFCRIISVRYLCLSM